MVPHAPQEQGFVKSTHHKDSIVIVPVGPNGLSSPEESEVAGPGINLTSPPCNQADVEVVLTGGVLAVNGEVAGGVVRALNPDLYKKCR